MILYRIQYRLIFIFVSLVIAIFLISGWMLHWMIRQSLETELGRKLMAVATASSVMFGEEEIGFISQGSGPRTENYLRDKLERMREATGVKRIYFFDSSGKSLLDTEDDIARGSAYFGLRFYRREIEEVQAGQSTYSVLFEGIDGLPTMTGYAPLYQGDIILGGVGVDGSATFLDSVNTMRRRLYLLGILGSCAAIGLGIFMAGSITRPIEKLVRASKRIGEGNYDGSIPFLGKGEIGLLAETMEEMRRGVVEREHELKAMLAGVAHEIRNPLGGIELFAGLLSDEVSEESEASSHVDRIVKEVGHLKKIVDHFLFYARPHDPNKEGCSLDDTVEETSHLVENQISQLGIVLSVKSEKPSIIVWADPDHLKRILLNLLQNAIQAMPNGGEIRIRWCLADGQVSIFVQDDGDGMSREVQEKIFTPFFTTRDQGTGLGLSIVKGLVEVNGGSIRLVRSDENGSEFEVKLQQYNQSPI